MENNKYYIRSKPMYFSKGKCIVYEQGQSEEEFFKEMDDNLDIPIELNWQMRDIFRRYKNLEKQGLTDG